MSDKKAQTRERILAAATAALIQRGPAEPSVGEVMGAAGLTVGGFYAHFDSKDALMLEAFRQLLGRRRSLLKQLGGEPGYTANIVHKVANGDLTADVELKAGDSSSLLASINLMQQNLRTMLLQIRDYSDQVAAAATELSQINEQTQRGIELQNTEISSSAVAMNQMTASLEEVSRNTQQAAGAADAPYR